MLHRFPDSIFCGILQFCLVNSVADHEHVVDSDTDKEERHQVVDAGRFSTQEEHQTETRGVSNTDTDKTNERDHETTMHRTERTKHQNRVNCDQNDSNLEDGEIILDVISKSLSNSLDRKQTDINVLGVFIPFFCLIHEQLFPNLVESLIYVFVARISNKERPACGLCFGELSNYARFFILLDLFRHGLSQEVFSKQFDV